jgi:hypothetical protein
MESEASPTLELLYGGAVTAPDIRLLHGHEPINGHCMRRRLTPTDAGCRLTLEHDMAHGFPELRDGYTKLLALG